MKYLLTEKEMSGFVKKGDLKDSEYALAEARDAILKAHNWICVHHVAGDRVCDGCPISHTQKEFKYKFEYDISKLICTKPRRYSK